MLRYSIGSTDPVWGELMKQIARLEQLERFPFGPEAKKDLGAALAKVDSLAEAKEVIDEFVNDARAGARCPLVGDIISVIEQRRSRKVVPIRPEPARPSANHCGRCQNSGYYGGKIDGPYAGEWKWCDCAAARRQQLEEPNLVDEANANRERLLHRFAVSMHKSKAVVGAMKSAADEYKGDF